MDFLLLALDVIHKESGKLKAKREKGQIINFREVKPLLKALASLAEDKEILEEAGKKSAWYKAGLKIFAGAIKNI